MFITTNPIPVKAAVNLLGLNVGGTRLPLINATPGQIDLISEAMKSMGLTIDR